MSHGTVTIDGQTYTLSEKPVMEIQRFVKNDTEFDFREPIDLTKTHTFSMQIKMDVTRFFRGMDRWVEARKDANHRLAQYLGLDKATCRAVRRGKPRALKILQRRSDALSSLRKHNPPQSGAERVVHPLAQEADHDHGRCGCGAGGLDR